MPKPVQRSPFRIAVDATIAPIQNPITEKRGDWAPAFLGALMQGARINKAAKVAGIHFTVVYDRRKSDEVFREAWREAADVGTEFLEQEAARRAYSGTLKPVFHKGMKCGYVREYSDVLLMFLLKKRNPAYRDGTTIVNNNNLQVNVFDDIERDIATITSNATSDSGVPQDRLAEPVDASQADRA